MLLQRLISGVKCLLPLALCLAGSVARAQQAGDTTSVRCGPPLTAMLCVDLDGRAS
ncbi:MAG: hypothetical protein H7Z21_03865, partial [Hymenobacter sp.]|nr:hypothetical protein [Hymenobacter sp.]